MEEEEEKVETAVKFFASEPLVDSLRSDNASGNDKQYFLRGISKEKAERGESK